MGVKGSWQRPGAGYAEGWDAIFGKKKAELKCDTCGTDRAKEQCPRSHVECPFAGIAHKKED